MLTASRSGILAIGDGMVELAPAEEGLLAMWFACDSFNTARSLRRRLPSAVPVRYFSAIGTEAASDRMAAFMTGQVIDIAHVARLRGASVGLYRIHLTGGGTQLFRLAQRCCPTPPQCSAT